MNPWEFDSHLDITVRGRTRTMQVWSRASSQWPDTYDWCLMEDTPGRENTPKPGRGHWTSTESFKREYPAFERCDPKH